MAKYRDFEDILGKIRDILDGDEYMQIKIRLKEVALNCSLKDTLLILQNAMKLNDNHMIKRQIYDALPDIYEKHPPLRGQILSILNSDFSDKELDSFYLNAGKIAALNENEDDTDFCLDKIEQKLNLPQNTPHTLKIAYRALGRLFDDNDEIKKRARIIHLIENGLDHINNDSDSFKAGERILNLKENLKSRAILGRRGEKSIENPFGFENIDEIPPDKPCIFILPGNGTTSRQILNGYFSDLESLLEQKNMKDKIFIYGAYYQFGDYASPDISIIKQMEKYHHLKGDGFDIEKENIDPRYVNQIFSKAVLNRIQGKDGKRLDFKTARQYIRNINFLAHCHGSFVFLKLEEKLENKMKALGYSPLERQELLHNFFCASFAPYAPLGVGQAFKISFVSATDQEINHFNQAEKSIRNFVAFDNFLPCYLSGKRGNVFIVPELSGYGNEHDWGGFGKRQKCLTENGEILNRFLESVLVGAMISSLNNTPLKDVRSLIEKGAQDQQIVEVFDTFEKNGEQMWQQIKNDIKASVMQRKLLEKHTK
ncbi:MAG: hypothetical protein J6S61_03615 [Elusimicrobiaceae bacterium]|nr:hypothetical protein [Elusimicrobiaceae bacterium]